MTTDAEIESRFNTRFRGTRAPIQCPCCGAGGDKRDGMKVCIYQTKSGGFRWGCWSCGVGCPKCNGGGSLYDLARRIGMQDYQPPEREERVEPEKFYHWKTDDSAAKWTKALSDNDFKRRCIAAWQSYKPIPHHIITGNHMIVGGLWFEKDGRAFKYWHERLLIPVFKDGRIARVAGRQYLLGDTGNKWLFSAGSEHVLAGLEDVRRGDTVVWVENLVDRVWLQGTQSNIKVVASGGLTWKQEWLQELKDRKPSKVMIWFDHDLSGQGSVIHDAEWRREWLARHPNIDRCPMTAAAPKLKRELNALGVLVKIVQWDDNSPHKADVGDVLQGKARVVW